MTVNFEELFDMRIPNLKIFNGIGHPQSLKIGRSALGEQAPVTGVRQEAATPMMQYTAFEVTIHITADSLSVTASVGDGLKVLCENSILEGTIPFMLL
jgi:hypothetical protein